MKKRLNRLLTLLVIMMMTTGVAMAQSEEQPAPLNLKVTVNMEEAGTLFVKIQEQIEELGELYDVGELTVTGPLNVDDYNVIRNQLTNITMLDLSATTAENGEDIWLGNWESKLRRCLLPRTATTLRWQCFEYCDSLRSVVLPEALTAIPYSCFYSCTHLESIDIPATVTMIYDGAFTNCVSLKSIELPQGLTNLGSSSFSGCSGLTSIELPQGLTNLGSYSFWRCSGLTSIVLPEGIKAIPDGFFEECSRLSEVKLPASLEVINSSAFASTAFRTFTLPEGVKIDGVSAFSNCDSLRTFYFPDGPIDKYDVGYETFRGCDSLHYVRLPETLTEIPSWFFGGTSLDTIALPASVRKIGQGAFHELHGLKRVVLPNSVTMIEGNAFMGWDGEEMVWPETVTTISDGMFTGCKNLRKIDIPQTVSAIGTNAFSSCSSLRSIRLPEAVTTIAPGTFLDCPKLENVTLSAQLKTIGVEAFRYCNQLKHIDLPDGVTSIGDRAFCDVPLQSLTLPKALKTLGYEAFTGGKYTHVAVPEGVLTIGDGCFSSDRLKVFDLPTTIIALGTNFVSGEKALDSLIIRAVIPPYGGYIEGNITNGTLYVPAKTLSFYQNKSNYNRMASIQPIDVAVDKLTITGYTAITPNNSLGTDKVDVEYRSLYDSGLSVSAKERPRLSVEEGAQLNIGTLSMNFDLVDIPMAYWWEEDPPFKFDVLFNRGTIACDQLDLGCKIDYETYFTPSFDVHMYDIVPELPNTPYVIYRYDGAARAAGNFSNTWVRVSNDEMLRAGQGYAYIGDKTITKDDKGEWKKEWSTLHFRSHQGGTDYLTTAGDITLPLNHYQGEFSHNRNWNFIGMPYSAFFYIRGLDFDGPVIVWNPIYSDWDIVTALDDDYVIHPMSAIFIQAPDGLNSLTFDADRRQFGNQLAKGDESNSRRALQRADKNAHRVVFNAILSRNAEATEQVEAPVTATTRFVINPEATTRYDIGRDAPAMAADNATLLYTMAGGVAYAINERPLDDGIIRLGMQLPKAGSYQMSLALKTGTLYSSVAEDVWLVDNETNTRRLLLHADGTPAEPYTFEVAEATTLSSRFLIAIGNADPTAITDIDEAKPQRMDGLFNLAGQRISAPQRGIYINNGKKVLK